MLIQTMEENEKEEGPEEEGEEEEEDHRRWSDCSQRPPLPQTAKAAS